MWSLPGHAFDLSDPDMRIWLYQTVLREAASPDDLSSFLNEDILLAEWPRLHLPAGTRQAWEDRHPVLRTAAVPAASSAAAPA